MDPLQHRESGLGALPRLLDDEGATCVLASLFPQSSVRVQGARLVRLKPGKRAVVRWRAWVDGEPQLYYAKLFATARAGRALAGHSAVRGRLVGGTAAAAMAAEAAVAVPEPAGVALDGTLLVMRALSGRPAAPQLSAGDESLARRIARALAAVHRAAAPLERRHTCDDELAVLERATVVLAQRSPGLAAEATELAGAVRRHLTGRPWRFASLHRDFYADQVLDMVGSTKAAAIPDGAAALGCAPGRAGPSEPMVGLIDFDDAKLGEPAVDVANLAAHLVLDALRVGVVYHAGRRIGGASESEHGALASRRAFLDEYAGLDPVLDSVSLAALEAGTLLRLASIHGLRSGPVLEERLVDAAWEALRGGDGASPPRARHAGSARGAGH